MNAAEDAAFCEGCGTPIPGAAPVSLRQTLGGRRQLRGHALQKKTRKAAIALLIVAVIATLGAVLVHNEMSDHFDNKIIGNDAKIIAAIQWVIAGIFWALWWWSRTNPFVAGIVGLTLFVTLNFVAAIVEPKTLFGGILLKAIIIIVLANAISAGATYRRMLAREERD